MYSDTIEKLIKLFSKFPTVGPRTAARFVFYLIKEPSERIEELLEAIKQLKNKIKVCSLCYKSFEPEQNITNSDGRRDLLCPICLDPRRDKSTVCIVEKEEDLEAIEKTGQYKGVYFILGGTLGLKSDKQKKALEDRVDKLCICIKSQPAIREVILALNPTAEGQTTALWLRRKLEPAGVKITQLGRGLPVGGELEYADEETLTSAFESRR